MAARTAEERIALIDAKIAKKKEEIKALEAQKQKILHPVTMRSVMEKAKAAGKEILVVCIGKTRRGEIERELESCRLQKIRVAGVVVVE